MRDLGEVKRFLGLEIIRDRPGRTLTVTATQHIIDMLVRFGMTDAKPVHTPFPSGLVLAPTSENEAPLLSSQYPYRALVGSLRAFSTYSLIRPEISFAVSQLARYQERPSRVHWDAAKHVLAFLKHTQHDGLSFSAAAAFLGLEHPPN